MVYEFNIIINVYKFIMKYKKQIVTGALAFSLLIGGSNVFAATPQDLGIKSTQPAAQQKQSKVAKTVKSKKENTVVGTVSAINSDGFTIEVKNIKTKVVSSVDVKTDTSTVYHKNGAVASASDLAVGQKVTAIGTLDKTTNTLTSKQVRMITTTAKAITAKKVTKKTADTKVAQ